MINSIFPAFTFLDNILGILLPGLLRLCIWGALAGVLALLLYRILSDQVGIRAVKAKIRQLRRDMMNAELEHDQFMALVRENLVTSLNFLRKVFLPSFLAAIPVLIPAAWLSLTQGYVDPAKGEILHIEVSPAESHVRASAGIVAGDSPGNFQLIVDESIKALTLYDDSGPIYARLPGAGLYPSVNKKQWWNTVLANEAGYVRGDSAVEEIRFSYRRKTFAANVPVWLVTWEFPFFAAVFIAALLAKVALRIE